MVKMISRITQVIVATLALHSVPLELAWAQAAQQPNIVVMMVDNMGYGDVGAYGGGAVRGAPTPNIDALAAEGLRLTNFNVEVECTPSRSAFMTGRLPIRSGTTRAPILGSLGRGGSGQPQPYGLAPWEITMAEMLAGVGYHAALFGKWHLGSAEGRLPNEQGFDEWWGYPHSSREAMHSSDPSFDAEVAALAYLMEGSKGEKAHNVELFNLDNRPLVDGMIIERSVEYIKRRARSGQPFFLLTAFFSLHFPSLPHPDFKGRSGNGDYADATIETDHHVGQVLAAIRDAGIEDRTVVIFISDNGALYDPRPGVYENWIGNNGPFRGELGTTLEGSVRTIGIIKWPGKIEAGRVSNEIFALLDFFPTIATIAGAQVPGDRPIDGVDQIDFLPGTQEHSNREHVMYFVGGELRAVKWRKFKVHFKKQDALLGPIQELRAPEVYNVERDPREEYNIAMSGLWVMEPITRYIRRDTESLERYPNDGTGGAPEN